MYMRTFAIVSCLLFMSMVIAGSGAALDPLDSSDWKEDPDRDGLWNIEEWTYGTDPNHADSDGGGCLDGWEVWFDEHRALDYKKREIISPNYHFNANDAIDEGVVVDRSQLLLVEDQDAVIKVNDPDADGWNNLHEYLVGTDPTDPNTDGDEYIEDSMDPDPLISQEDPAGSGGSGDSDDGHGEGQGGSEGSGGGDPGPN
jgi:hypothetical protein